MMMTRHRDTCKVVIIYAIFGFCWIYFSDKVLGWFVRDPQLLTQIAIFKGLLFIVCTSALLFFLITRLGEKIQLSTDALHASEERLQFLVKNSSDSLVVVNADGSQRYVSPAAERITGFPAAELEGKTLDTLIHPDDMQAINAAWNEALQHPEKTVTVQYRHIHKTKGWVFSEAIAQSFLSEPSVHGVIASVRDITERKQADEALRAITARQEAILAAVPDIIMQVNAELTCIWSNRAGLEFFGDEVVGRKADFFLANEQNKPKAKGLLSAEGEKTAYFESRQKRKDGDVRLLAWWCKTIETEQGDVTGILLTARDITKHQQIEDERQSHLRFLENLERVDRIIKQEDDVEQLLTAMVRTVFSIFDCDRAWLLYPCNPDAPSFRVPVEVTKPEYPGAQVLNVDVLMSPGEAMNMREALASDSPVTYTDGTDRPITTAKMFGVQSQMFIPIFPKLGEPWVFGMHQCSYPRIWTAEEKKLFREIGRRVSDGLSSVLYLRELRENEQRFRATFEQAAVGIAHISPDGQLLRVNQKLCDILGYSRDEILKKTFNDLACPDDLDTDPAYAGRLLSGEISAYTLEKRYLRKDHSTIWINLTVSVNRQVLADSPEYFIAVLEDITKRKQAEEEKTKLQDQLIQAQKMESIGQLAGGIAHDFNNMLGVILGHAELAMDQLDSHHPLFATLAGIRKAAGRSADITRQLLAFARKQTIMPKVLDLNEAIEGTLKMLRRLIGEDIDLTWRPGSGLWKINMDPSQVDQILTNLCVNARDAIAGVGEIIVETGNCIIDEEYCAAQMGCVAGEYVRIQLSDTGCGMRKETIEHIFEPFFTTKGVGEGTGLGLSTVYGAVRQNSGFINTYSEPGQGTTFKIYLPRHINAAESEEAGQEENIPPVSGHETTLLVEDEPSILEMTSMMLQRLGYRVLAADTTGKAIALADASAGPIHLLITDIVMPGMNGRDLAEKVIERQPGIKCLFMSGYAANIITNQGTLDEGVHFIQKPFSKKELAAKIRETLES